MDIRILLDWQLHRKPQFQLHWEYYWPSQDFISNFKFARLLEVVSDDCWASQLVNSKNWKSISRYLSEFILENWVLWVIGQVLISVLIDKQNYKCISQIDSQLLEWKRGNKYNSKSSYKHTHFMIWRAGYPA